LGGDATPRLWLDNGDHPGRLYQAIGASRIASALIAGAAYLQPRIISLFSSGLLREVVPPSLFGAPGAPQGDAGGDEATVPQISGCFHALRGPVDYAGHSLSRPGPGVAREHGS
jgi:hypothetical protein